MIWFDIVFMVVYLMKINMVLSYILFFWYVNDIDFDDVDSLDLDDDWDFDENFIDEGKCIEKN